MNGIKVKNLNWFKDLIDTGYEVQFTLGGTHFLAEPDQQAPDDSERCVLANNDNLDEIHYFNNVDELVDFSINHKPLKQQMGDIVITDY